VGAGETWAEILRPQLLDLVLLSAFIAFAMVSFFRKSVALKYVTSSPSAIWASRKAASCR